MHICPSSSRVMDMVSGSVVSGVRATDALVAPLGVGISAGSCAAGCNIPSLARNTSGDSGSSIGAVMRLISRSFSQSLSPPCSAMQRTMSQFVRRRSRAGSAKFSRRFCCCVRRSQARSSWRWLLFHFWPTSRCRPSWVAFAISGLGHWLSLRQRCCSSCWQVGRAWLARPLLGCRDAARHLDGAEQTSDKSMSNVGPKSGAWRVRTLRRWPEQL